MAEIIHRYVNGTEVSSSELCGYQITNRTILDIVSNAIQRIHSNSKDYPVQAALEANTR